MKLLIVEDERELSESIVCFLRHEDYLCEQAFTYDEAMLRVAVYEYDCVLLDLMLPDGTGLDVLRKVKRVAPQTGVIIVSAKDSLDDKVEGLRLGADDYLPKPFHLPELSMRIFALLRRRCYSSGNLLQVGPVSRMPSWVIIRLKALATLDCSRLAIVSWRSTRMPVTSSWSSICAMSRSKSSGAVCKSASI